MGRGARIKLLREALLNSWSKESSTVYTVGNPAKGQCGVTSLVVNDFLGGDILKTKVDKVWHFYNRIDGEVIDFTKSQFTKPIKYKHVLSNREEAFEDTNSYQYGYLKAAVSERIPQ